MNYLTSTMSGRAITCYLTFCYLINTMICVGLIDTDASYSLTSLIFILFVAITYPAIYMLPIILVSLLYCRSSNLRTDGTKTRLIAAALLLSSNFFLSVLLYADVHLYHLYGFHINRFAINLLMTPGGVASLGAGPSTYLAGAMTLLALLILNIAALLIAPLVRWNLASTRSSLLLASVFAVLCLGERLAYGISDVRQYTPILKASLTFPLYNQVTFRSLAKKLGITPINRIDVRLSGTTSNVSYPLGKIDYEVPAKRKNIIWLTAESLRWDMMSPEIMPATFAQSRMGWRLDNHHSGGNGTRQGLFSLFYGIYGSYWEAFLLANCSPLILDILQQQGYDLQMFTSADFTYPEFDQTLFAKVPDSNLHQYSNARSQWQRDRDNTDQIVTSIRDRDPDTPFMIFMFYDATHAGYDFPEDTALESSYTGELNYATMSKNSLKNDIGLLKNRYINASHFIDGQMARIFKELDRQNLWQDTIVMFTGDHGEEFMENGFWGHNSGFSEQQIRTPMVLWLPDQEAKVITDLTSHMDIVPTLLPLLGVKSPSSNYSLGTNLFDAIERPYIVVSDWAGVAMIDAGQKFSIPFNSSLSSTNQLYDRDDNEISNPVPFLTSHRNGLQELMSNAARFSGRSDSTIMGAE